MSDQNLIVRRVLAGHVKPEDLPEIPKRVVRVFLASAGIDSHTERNTFIEKVYPRLRGYCSQKYGVDFQMVDLEWGVPKQDYKADLSVEDLKFKELQKCQDLSAGPSFLVFIGQKYGETQLPAIIPSDEYEVLQVALKGYKSRDSRTPSLLDEWYQKDDNSIPPIHVLTSKRKNIPDFLGIDESKQQIERTRWLEEQQEMKKMLQKAAEVAYFEGFIDIEAKMKYHMSSLDLLTQVGTGESSDPKSQCAVVMRTIVDLKNYVDDPKASEFSEVLHNDRIDMMELDGNCLAKIENLKTRTKGLISTKNCLQYDVLWRYDDVIDPKLHEPYLNKLCTDLFDTMKDLIDETVPKRKFDLGPELYEEVLQHWLRCKGKAMHFYGQEEPLSKMKNYLLDETCKPLVVFGEVGSGKSTLLSKIAREVAEGSRDDTICILRYIGYTPKSSDIKQILITICSQLNQTLGRTNSDIPYDTKDLQRYFNLLLNSVPSGLTVVIILVSLEKLIPEYNAHLLSWLPNKLKRNIKIIVSTHSTKHTLLDRLKGDIVKDTSYMIGVTQMPLEDAEGLMQFILSLHSRKVTSLQQYVFKNKLSECSLAMFVHILTHQAKLLRSFDELHASDIPSSINQAIHWLFLSLEKKHGKILVARTLSYLVASEGLSDCEMEDLLSLDDDVLNSIFVTYHPPVRRIPFSKWLSIKDDIEPFLNFREADGVTIYMWCHEEFDAVAREMYLHEENVKKDIHSMLADYFLGVWANKKKPVKALVRKGEASHSTNKFEAERFIAPQPLSFEAPGEPVRYNKRKYDQVPRHLYLAGRLKELNSLVLFNYKWLYNKIKALSLTHILADFVLNPGEEATLVEQALRVAESTIQSNINNLAPEISGHLLPYYKSHPNIRALVHQCDIAGLEHCALIPNFPYLQVPGSSLQYTLTSPVSGDFYLLTFDDRCLLVKVKDSSTVYRFDVATGETKSCVFASNGDLYVTPNGKLFVIVDHFTEKAIKIHNSESGEFIGQLIVMNHIELKVKEKYKMGAVSITDERMCVIVTTDASYLCIADLIGCQFLQIIGLDGKCDVCEIAPNGRFVFCNSNEFMLCYDMFSLEHICTVSAGHRPSCLAFTKDGFRAFIANSNEIKLLVMHIHRGAIEMAYKTPFDEEMHDDKIVNLKVSRKDDLVLVQGLSNILVFNRFTEKVCAKLSRPEDVPKEFKLPKCHYTGLFFTNADFTRDGNFVIASIFRNIYLWQISTGSRIASIQAPVGIISEMLVSNQRSQVITHVNGSREIQVWNIDEAVNQIHMLDKLTSAIQDIKLTSDNSLAYVKCKNSDELGVIDMCNGMMLDLLTHDTVVEDFACTPDGKYVIVSCKPKKRNAAVKIWDMDERKVVKEFSNTTGYCICAQKTQSIIYVAQEETDFQVPYYITKFSFLKDGLTENTHPLSLKYILDKPFLTSDDQNMIVLTAQDYIENDGEFDTPTICAFSLNEDYKVSYYTPESFQDIVNINTIKKLIPCYENRNTIVVLYTTNTINNSNISFTDQLQLGLLVLDINTGAINKICEPFLKSYTRIESIIFSGLRFCIDSSYNIFNINNGSLVSLPDPGTPPSNLALFGSAVIYFMGSNLFVRSIVSGKQIAKCFVHSTISHVTVCSDQRTVIVGCQDGRIVSYILIDPTIEDAERIVSKVGSRSMSEVVRSRLSSRCWDKVENDFCPTYSRPPSALSNGPKEKILLKQVQAIPKFCPDTETFIYLNERSKTCSVQ